MDVAQGEVWWADLPAPQGSSAGYLRPVVIIQGNMVNRSRTTTYLCTPLTGNTGWQIVPTNVLLPAAASGLDKDSVAQTALTFAVTRAQLTERVGSVGERHLQRLFRRLDIALGRTTL